MQQSIARGIAWVSLAAGVVALCDLVGLALILRFWVDAEQFGAVSVVITTFGALGLLVEAGLTSAVVQRDGGDDNDARLSSVFWFGVGFGALIYGLIWIAAPVIARADGQPMITDLFRAAGALLVIRPLYTTHQALLRRQLKFAQLSKLRVFVNVLELGVKLSTAAAGAGPWCFVFGALAREATYAIGVPLIVRWRPRLTFAFARIREDFRFGLRSTGAEFVYQLYSNFDYQVVGYVFGATALGHYRAAYELVLEPVRFLSGIVTTIAFPTFARLRSDRPALIAQFVAFLRQNLAVVLLLVAVLIVTADDALVLVYGADYAIAAGAARILAIVGVLRALSHLGPPLLDGIGRPDLSLRYQLTAAAVLCTGFLLGAQLGSSFDAVAWAWAIGYPIAFLVLGRMLLAQLQLGAIAFLRRISRIVALMAFACGAGLLVRAGASSLAPLPRFGLAGGTVLGLGAVLLGMFEGFSPRAIAQRIRG